MHFLIINGPNLNLLGKREPELYGHESFESYLEKLRTEFDGHQLDYFQSNNEGDMIDKLHEAGFSLDGIVINGGGFSHTSVALADAISSIKSPVVAVHISNTMARESYRQVDLLGGKCKGAIIGLGLSGYRYAVQALIEMGSQS